MSTTIQGPSGGIEFAPAATLGANVPITIEPDDAGTAGVAGAASREDHEHPIAADTAVEITDATNSEGASTSFARANHLHAHGSRGGGSLHAVATSNTNGFMSAADKAKLDATKEIWFNAVNYDANLGNYRVQNVAGTGAQRFTFHFPIDFTAIVRLVLVGVPLTGAAGVGKNIDLFSDYATAGELYNTHSQSDTASTYNTGSVNTFWRFNIAPLFMNAAAEDFAGILVDHQSIGGTISYPGIELEYT